ncbi:hypothetical protein AB1Y20_011053 [Prymnesium parvum]|uniref:Chromo domain-containing protein n=1 Tax=Prymnesium parvum TaxID=97485 RepID=A0AB34IN80_PRYPA
MAPKRKQAVEAPRLTAPQGRTYKRTPTSSFDPAAGSDIYEPEAVLAQRVSKGVTQWLVKWVGYSEKDNTWEPIEHLAGCEDMISEFKEKEKVRNAELTAAEERRKKEKQQEAARVAEEAAAAAATARVAHARGEDAGAAPAAAAAPGATNKLPSGPGKGSKRSSLWWTCFSEEGAEKGYAHCVLMKDGKLCNEAISCAHGPTALRNHVMYVHPDDFIRIEGQKKAAVDAEFCGSSEKASFKQQQQTLPVVPAKPGSPPPPHRSPSPNSDSWTPWTPPL